jgi:rhamnosyltransferase subunit B
LPSPRADIARIILATFGSLGDIHPMLATALELQRRGHQPVLATSESYREKLTAAGVEFQAIRPDLSPDDKPLLRAVMDEHDGPKYLIRRVMMPRIQQTFDDLLALTRGADLLVTSELVFVGQTVAELARKPWIVVTLAPLSFFSRYDPPILLQDRWLAALVRFSMPMYVRLVQFSQWSIRHWSDPVRRLRREHGLTGGRRGVFGPRVDAAAIIAMFSPSIGAPQPDWPANVHLTGFAFYDHHEPMPASLSEFLDAGEPPIVFTLGSAAVYHPGSFYRDSAAAAARIGRRAVLLVGTEPHDLPTASDRVAVAAYAPYSELFPRCAAVVHQGGIGTTAQALRAGRPMLIVPFSHDQPDNAARMVRLGVAKALSRRDYDVDTASSALRTLLENPTYTAEALSHGARVQQEDGARAAADVIERTATFLSPAAPPAAPATGGARGRGGRP